jgi:hypothetical protein
MAFLLVKIGQRVGLRGGCLEELEESLVSENKDHNLVISVESIQRFLALRGDGYDAEAV